MHGVLGATTAAIQGTDALSGAVSGIVGEVSADALKENTNFSNKTIAELSGLAGGLSSIVTGEFSNQSDTEVAENIYAGQRIGKNAAENNALYLGGQYRVPLSDYITGKGNDYDVHGGVQGNILVTGANIGTDGVGANVDVIPSVGVGAYINVVPRGEKPLTSVIWGMKNIFSYNGIVTRNGNVGHGLTLGIALPSISPINTSIHLPIQNDKK